MGDNADDCYEGVLREMDDMAHDDGCFGVGPERGLYHSQPLGPDQFYRSLQSQNRTRRPSHREMVAQRNLNLTPPDNRDWMFVTIEKAWPFNSHNFKVIQPDLKSAIKDFFTNEYHKPFRNDKPIPDYHIDVQIQTTGGWIVYGETQTVLIFCR